MENLLFQVPSKYLNLPTPENALMLLLLKVLVIQITSAMEL